MSYSFSSDNIPASTGRKFGLNQGVRLTSFTFTKELGKFTTEDGIILIEFTLQGEEKPMRHTIFAPNNKPVKWEKGSAVELKKGTEEYKKAIDRANKDVVSVLTHIVKALGVKEEDIEAAFEIQKPTKFGALAKLYNSLLPKNYSEIELDIFLQWQKKIGKNNTRKFLEVPSKMYTGKFLCPATEGEWDKVVGADGSLKYVKYDSEGGITEVHPFVRSKDFMEGDYGKYDSEDRLSDNISHESSDEDEDLPFDHENAEANLAEEDDPWA